MYFDSINSSSARKTKETFEIVKAEANSADTLHASFFLVYFKKKKEYRTRTVEERDEWIRAFDAVLHPDNGPFIPNAKRLDSSVVTGNAVTTEDDGADATAQATHTAALPPRPAEPKSARASATAADAQSLPTALFVGARPAGASAKIPTTRKVFSHMFNGGHFSDPVACLRISDARSV